MTRRNPGKPRKYPLLTDTQKSEIERLRGELGWTYKKIAVQINASKSGVNWYCLRAGIEKPDGPPPEISYTGPMVVKRGNHVVRRFRKEEDVIINLLSDRGLTPAEIARQLDRKHNSILGRMATLARQEERRLARQGLA